MSNGSLDLSLRSFMILGPEVNFFDCFINYLIITGFFHYCEFLQNYLWEEALVDRLLNWKDINFVRPWGSGKKKSPGPFSCPGGGIGNYNWQLTPLFMFISTLTRIFLNIICLLKYFNPSILKKRSLAKGNIVLQHFCP